jgi:hypothetical protein
VKLAGAEEEEKGVKHVTPQACDPTSIVCSFKLINPRYTHPLYFLEYWEVSSVGIIEWTGTRKGDDVVEWSAGESVSNLLDLSLRIFRSYSKLPVWFRIRTRFRENF